MNLLIGLLLITAGVFLIAVGVKGTYKPVAQSLGLGAPAATNAASGSQQSDIPTLE